MVDHVPMVFAIVGDPERADIVSDWKSSGKNYTGVETPGYYSKVVRLMHHYLPFKLPMDVGGKLTIDVNLKAAPRIGFEPPFELLSAADNLFQHLAAEKDGVQP
jgi:hypothetical protein